MNAWDVFGIAGMCSALAFTAGVLLQRWLLIERLRDVCTQLVLEDGGPNSWGAAARAEWFSAEVEGRPARIALVGGEWMFSEDGLPENLRIDWKPGVRS